MIRFEAIDLYFNRGLPSEVKALDNISLELSQGSFTLLIGSNGSGKSSLLNLLAGTVRQDNGSIYFQGSEISKLADFKRSAFISRIFQNPMQGTAPEMTLLENFRLAALRDGNRRLFTGLNAGFRRQVAEKVSRLGMGLEQRLDQKMGSFSGGQRQALSLLMATWCDTSVLLMDEPTAALDPASAALVFNLARSLVHEKGITCLMVTHNLKQCLQAGTRLIQFAEGKVRHDLSGAEKAQLGFTELAAWFS